MRTTLSLNDDVFDVTRTLAEQRKMSLSEAFNYLVRRGLDSAIPTSQRNGFEVFGIEATTARFGVEEVEKALESDDADLLQSFRR